MNNLRIQLEKPSDIKRKLVITVPAPSVQNHFEKEWNATQKKAHLKGFRKGKVPMDLVRKYFVSDVRSKVLQNLLEESYWNAVKEEKLQPLGQPHIHGEKEDAGVDIQEDKDFTFVATFEVYPEIKLGKYTGFSLKSQDATVAEEEFQAQLKSYQENKAQLKPMSEEESASYKTKLGDYVDLKFDGQIVTETGFEKNPSLSGSRLVEIGKGELVPGFEDQLIGMKKGEKGTVSVTMPTPYHSKDLEGKKVEFAVEILEVKTKDIPELNDELAQEYQFESLDDLKKTVKQSLEERKKQAAEAALKTQLLEQIVANNEFEVPGAMVQSQSKSIAEEQVQYFKRQGFPEAAINEYLKKEWPSIEKNAVFQVKSGLLLDAISKKESLEVTDADFEAEIKKMSESSGLEEEKVREFYAKGEYRENLRYKIKEDKTVQFVLSQCKIK